MRLLPHTIMTTTLLVACGGGKATLEIDAALVDQRIDEIAEAMPNCSASGTVAETGETTDDQITPVAGTGSSGSCGGLVDVTYDHDNGTTDYVAAFSAFCMSSPNGDIVIDGTFKATEEGTPSDYGPIISALSMETDGPMEVTAAGERITFELSGARTTFGYPDTWYPGIPDDDNPDVVKIDKAEVIFHEHDRNITVEDLVVERSGPWPSTITVTGGVLGAPEGTVLISTPSDDPLIVSLSGVVEDGALELTGASDTSALVTPGAGDLTADFTVNGTAHERGLDCSAGQSVFNEALTTVMLALLPSR